MILEPLKAGDFRTRLNIQTPTQVRGTDGGYQKAWVYLKSVWAYFIPIDTPTRPTRSSFTQISKETLVGGQLRSQQRHVIMIRAQPETIRTDWRLTTNDGRVFNIVEVNLVENVKKMVRIGAQENLSQPDNPSASGFTVTSNRSFTWGEIDFTLPQSEVISIPTSYYLIPKIISGFVSVLGGTVLTEPIINLGIPSNHTKYLNAKPFTQLSALYSSQSFTQFLANAGETQLWLEIATGGTVSTGTYRGSIFLNGDQIG